MKNERIEANGRPWLVIAGWTYSGGSRLPLAHIVDRDREPLAREIARLDRDCPTTAAFGGMVEIRGYWGRRYQFMPA